MRLRSGTAPHDAVHSMCAALQQLIQTQHRFYIGASGAGRTRAASDKPMNVSVSRATQSNQLSFRVLTDHIFSC